MYKINKERLIKTFTDLVKIPSPSWQEKDVVNYIMKCLKGSSTRCTKYKCRDSFNLLVNIKGKANKKPVLFSAHTDTVIPCDNIQPVVSGNRISSGGDTILGSDDKAAIAMFIEAFRCLKDNNISHGPIEALFSCAEEIGLQGIKNFNISLIKSRLAFVFDSSGSVGKIVYKAPYHSTIDLTIKGKAAHAGIEPEKGINAISVLSEIIAGIPGGRIDSETTLNIGIISGGKATNIVAEEAICKLEVRSINKTKLNAVETKLRKKVDAVTKKYGAKFNLKRNLEYSGFSLNKNDKISKITQLALKNIGLKPEFEISGGGSDTNILNSSGIKAINLSCGMQKVHTSNEYILIKDLINGTKLALSIIDSV